MASLVPKLSDRCMFLELPIEIRISIYEEINKEHSGEFCDLMVKATALAPGWRELERPKTMALAQVNQQIRKEFLPIISRSMWITISTGTEEDRVQARNWLAVSYEELINNVEGYCFAPCPSCSEHLMIPIDDVNSFEIGRVGFCSRIDLSTWDEFIVAVQGKVRALETSHDGRRNMTKAALGDILETFCMMSMCYRG